jgi:hypothetical protein
MKKLPFVVFAVTLFACSSETNDASTKEEPKTEPTEQLTYAYTLKDQPSDNWDRGDQKNVVLVLNSLKAFENNKLDECMTYFADSVQFTADGFDAKLSKDSLKNLIQTMRSDLKTFEIQMEDYEAVISKDKKREWVSLWYKEKWTDNKGMTDSIFYMDDVRVSNGKITAIDEKSRKYPKK